MEALRLYQFLTAIDEKYNSEKNDLLKKDPLPTLEAAYREIRRAEERSVVLQRIPSDESSQGIGHGLATHTVAARGHDPGYGQGRGTIAGRGRGTSRSSGQRKMEDKEGLTCSHCGQKRHKRNMLATCRVP